MVFMVSINQRDTYLISKRGFYGFFINRIIILYKYINAVLPPLP
jgi:hypothetical protein